MKKDFPFKLKDSSFKMENSVPLAVPLVYTIRQCGNLAFPKMSFIETHYCPNINKQVEEADWVTKSPVRHKLYRVLLTLLGRSRRKNVIPPETCAIAEIDLAGVFPSLSRVSRYLSI